MHRVLLIGEDQTLLETRNAIFCQAGYGVETCLIHHDPNREFICLDKLDRYFGPAKIGPGGKVPFNAVILCHSLNKERAGSIVNEAKREAPDMKIVILEPPEGPRIAPGCCDASIPVASGPAVLLHTVHSLLKDRQQNVARSA